MDEFVPHPARILAFKKYSAAFRGRLEATVLDKSTNQSNDMFAKIASKVISDKFVASIFDVSNLREKLPEENVGDAILENLVLPGEGAIYLSFGESGIKANPPSEDYPVTIEGAYVVTADDTGSVTIHLMMADPNFDPFFARPLGETIMPLQESLQIEIAKEMTVSEAFTAASIRSDSLMVNYDLFPVHQAYDLVVKSMLFLASNDEEFAYGSYLGDENGLVLQAKTGDRTAAKHLRENNFPLVNWVGQGIANTVQLDIPERQTFKI